MGEQIQVCQYLYFCAAIDDCLSNPCNNGGTCSDLKDDISCDCQPGYSGKFCEMDNDECLSDPCFQGATCVDKVISTFRSLNE